MTHEWEERPRHLFLRRDFRLIVPGIFDLIISVHTSTLVIPAQPAAVVAFTTMTLVPAVARPSPPSPRSAGAGDRLGRGAAVVEVGVQPVPVVAVTK